MKIAKVTQKFIEFPMNGESFRIDFRQGLKFECHVVHYEQLI